MAGDKQTVAVLGASPKPERTSHQAVLMLLEHGHRVIPVHPAVDTIAGLPATPRLSDITEPIDTLTMYVSESISSKLADDILRLRPGRVVFNPGAENPALKMTLIEHGIASEEACTLVLLNTGQF
ncbi:MAG: CoA-binding protein [bacterium]